ncbi:MAG: hypothetical protein KAT54_02935 [Candidatus Marinimicrobia bacterium]|jgi:alanyl-tRNA synthetase|nr:hypothetical protein [Candidatus Neomarinimicrobiota bacterium]
MDKWIDYLSANPVIALALVIVLILFVFMVFRKLIKWAVISFIILAVAGGLSYNEAQKQPQIVKDILKKGESLKEKVLKEGEKAAEKAMEELKKNVKDKTKIID